MTHRHRLSCCKQPPGSFVERGGKPIESLSDCSLGFRSRRHLKTQILTIRKVNLFLHKPLARRIRALEDRWEDGELDQPHESLISAVLHRFGALAPRR
jgi:hypothetical protein